jgi:hypothetical protein
VERRLDGVLEALEVDAPSGFRSGPALKIAVAATCMWIDGRSANRNEASCAESRS